MVRSALAFLAARIYMEEGEKEGLGTLSVKDKHCPVLVPYKPQLVKPLFLLLSPHVCMCVCGLFKNKKLRKRVWGGAGGLNTLPQDSQT